MKKKDLDKVGWTLLAGSAGFALYLLLRPKESTPVAMVPTVDPRFPKAPIVVPLGARHA